MTLSNTGYLGIGTTDPTYDLDVRGILNVTSNSYLASATLSGNIDMQSNDITNVDKLTVTTIDPVYTIDGVKYATYVADYAGGVTTETSGRFILDKIDLQKNQFAQYKYVIDFNNLDKGSDLWLFWQTSTRKLEDLVIALTAGFSGQVWYEKEGGGKVVIYAVPHTFDPDQELEISYRLTAPRQDADQWPNLISETAH